jgi:hypothetical protein
MAARNVHEVAKAAALVHGWHDVGQDQRPMLGLSLVQVNIHAAGDHPAGEPDMPRLRTADGQS